MTATMRMRWSRAMWCSMRTVRPIASRSSGSSARMCLISPCWNCVPGGWRSGAIYLEMGVDGFKDRRRRIHARPLRVLSTTGKAAFTMRKPLCYGLRGNLYARHRRKSNAIFPVRAISARRRVRFTGRAIRCRRLKRCARYWARGWSLGALRRPRFWSFDIGGFAGPLPTAGALSARKTAMAAFVPVMQWHSETARRTVRRV